MGSEAHDDLVKKASHWLRHTRGCRVVATELVTATSETPDAIGFTNRESIVVECKVSREDFRRNASKPHELAEASIGDERWFLTPEGLVGVEEVPEGWGLLEVHLPLSGTRAYWIKQTVKAPRRSPGVASMLAERAVLVSIAWRSLEALSLVKPLTLGEG